MATSRGRGYGPSNTPDLQPKGAPMTIESGTTSDRRNRIVIFLAMCVMFGAWFGLDGFIRYPAKNFAWARQNLARVEGLAQRTDLKTNPKALLESLKKVQPGMALAEVKALLGEPTFANPTDCCYIGPAAYGWFTLRDGKIDEVKKVEMNSEPSENDIRLNRTIAGLMAVIALATLVHLIRVLKQRLILDDNGLRIAGRQIGWEAMQALATQAYARKGWIDLQYASHGATASVRLDSYAIDRFDEIVTEICRRKGFDPLARPADEAAPDHGAGG
jgi:hypothetical protein